MARQREVNIMSGFMAQFLKDLEKDPMVKKTTYEMFRGKHPQITFHVGGNIEQVTILSPETSTFNDFLAAFGLDAEEGN